MTKYYNDLKLFAFPNQISNYLAGNHSAPIHIRLKPTNRCNHNCWFCAYRVDHLPLGEEMKIEDEIPYDKMTDLVDDIIEMGVKAVTFSGGGEPLIYPYIYEVIDKLTSAEVKVAILTNGSLLKGKLADLIAEKCSWVRISTDSWDGPSHAKQRNTSEADFDNIMSNIANFTAREPKAVLSINYIVTASSYKHILNFCSKMKNLNVSHIKLSACIVSPSLEDNNKYHMSFYEEASSLISKATKQLTDDDFHVVNHYHTMSDEFKNNFKSCHFINFLTVIGADCNVYTCHDKAYTESGRLGSFREIGFKEYWYSKDNIERLKAINPSKDCNHHCVATHKNKMLQSLMSMNIDHSDFI